MNLPALETQIAQSVHDLNIDQQVDIMQHINNYLKDITARKKEVYRKNALKEIRKALKTI